MRMASTRSKIARSARFWVDCQRLNGSSSTVRRRSSSGVSGAGNRRTGAEKSRKADTIGKEGILSNVIFRDVCANSIRSFSISSDVRSLDVNVNFSPVSEKIAKLIGITTGSFWACCGVGRVSWLSFNVSFFWIGS